VDAAVTDGGGAGFPTLADHPRCRSSTDGPVGLGG
jgi:hypothetical protein